MSVSKIQPLILVALVCGVLFVSSLAFVPVVGSNSGDALSPYFPSAGGLAFQDSDWRLATSEDIDELMDRFGVGTGDQEPVMVDGHGTGLVPNSLEEWDNLVGRLIVFDSIDTLATLPTSFDLSLNPEFPAVGNQESQGSCSAWAGTYYSYGYLEAVDNGWVEASEGNAEQLLSPAWTYNMVNGGRDSGSWIDTNMMIAVDWGVATMARMPYDDSDCTSWGSPEAFREAPLHRADTVGYLTYSPSQTIDEIKTLVSQGTPVAFALDAGQFAPGFNDGNYIISSDEYSSLSLNHAQTIVGFDDSVTDDSNVGAFRVVNSWGSLWGDSGYYWFTYDALKELGSSDILTMNFITDIEDYVPSLLGVWHFDTAPLRSADISIGLVSQVGVEAEKTPFYDGDEDPRAREAFPTFMCLDVTEMSEMYWGSAYDMFLNIGDSKSTGEVSSFKIEAYDPAFVPGVATLASAQSPDVPHETPCVVHNRLDYYSPITIAEALDLSISTSSSSGQASWVGVDHHSSGDGDSMQSGDVSDDASSLLEVEVEGPVVVSFDWRVSSQSSFDTLAFLVDGHPIHVISGSATWATVVESVSEGSHTLGWLYEKDSSVSSLGDCGWVDALELSEEEPGLPVLELEPFYDAFAGELFTITPTTVESPSDADMVVWYDWGDSSPWSLAGEAEGYSASHTYGAADNYIMTAYVEDEYGQNVSDDAQVRVVERNEVPSIEGFSYTPDGVLEPGQTVSFEIVVLDEDGDAVTVSASFGDGTDDDEVTVSVTPGVEMIVPIEHLYVIGSDSPFSVFFTVSDEAEHFNPHWASVSAEILVNFAPVAVLVVDEDVGDVGDAFTFDASESYDLETGSEDLVFRYDWTADGIWDTDWMEDAVVPHCYDEVGSHDVRVEVRDGAGLTSVATATIFVTGEAIPEFSALVVPVASMLVLVLLGRTLGRSRGRKS